MKRVTRADILPLERYESRRERVRRRILALKARRRVILPPQLSLLFENRETVWYQVQEMLRIERIVKPRAVKHELDTYNALVPRAGCLCATLFIEVPGLHQNPRILARYVGLADGDRLWLEAGGEKCFARFDEAQFSEDRIAAVQYLVFEPTATVRAALADPRAKAAIVCSHRANPARVPISTDLRRELAADLRTPRKAPGSNTPRKAPGSNTPRKAPAKGGPPRGAPRGRR